MGGFQSREIVPDMFVSDMIDDTNPEHEESGPCKLFIHEIKYGVEYNG